jgi:outer membrane receptor for ferrienterochelin and colicins
MFLRKRNLALSLLAILIGVGLAWSEEEAVYMGDLGVIVITPTRGPRMVKDLPTNVNVITREEIAESGALNVGEVLKNRLGIEIRRYGTLGASSYIALRGCSAFQTLVMVDGRSVNSISDGIADLSQFPIDNIERIEVVRGPASALYGANALGGVVNIITREAKDEKVTAEVNVAGGSFGTQISRLNFATRDTNIKAYFTVSKNTSNGWRKNSEYDSDNFTGRLTYDVGKIGSFEFRGGYYRGKLGLPGAIYEGLDEREAADPYHNQEDVKEYAVLEYLTGGENSKLSFKAYGSNDQRRDRNPTEPRDDSHQNITQGVEAQLNIPYGITMGADFHQDRYRQKNEIISQTLIGKKNFNQSVFLQETICLKPFTAILGARYDHHSAYGGQINPHLSLIYLLSQPEESLKLSFNLARGFRAPTFCDLYQPYALYGSGEWSYEAQGNPNLKPEKAWAYDIGFEHQLGNLLLSRLTLFSTNIEDLIDWTSVPSEKSSGLWFPSNVAKAYTQGIEIEFMHQIMPGLSQSINYTYLHSAGKREGEDKYEIAPYKPHNRVNYKINYTNNFGLKISLGTEYVDEQWSERGETGNRLPDYFLLNARIAQTIRSFEAYISFANILGKKYQTVFGYPMPGRTIMGGISWKFGS